MNIVQNIIYNILTFLGSNGIIVNKDNVKLSFMEKILTGGITYEIKKNT